MPMQSPLKNGNRQGDFRKAPRCGARTRRGTACQCPAIQGRRRCRLHGGLSTGPRTQEGIEHIRRANTKHGAYAAEARAERMQNKQLLRQGRLEQLEKQVAQFITDHPQRVNFSTEILALARKVITRTKERQLVS